MEDDKDIRGEALLAATLAAAQYEGRPLTAQEEKLLGILEMSGRARSGRALSRQESEALESGRGELGKAASKEFRRWRLGARSPTEREAHWQMRQQAQQRQRILKQHEQAEAARQLAEAEHEDAMAHWRHGQRLKRRLTARATKQAEHEAALFCECSEPGVALRRALDVIIRKASRGGVVSDDERRLLSGHRLVGRIHAGHLPSPSEMIELKALEQEWRDLIFESVKAQLLQDAARHEQRMPPPPDASVQPQAMRRWDTMLRDGVVLASVTSVKSPVRLLEAIQIAGGRPIFSGRSCLSHACCMLHA